MRADDSPEDYRIESTELDLRLRSMVSDHVPEDLLSRCLATIDPSLRAPRPRRMCLGRWPARIASAAAVLALIGGLAFVIRPGSATAAHFLQAVRAAGPRCLPAIVRSSSSRPQSTEPWKPGSCAVRGDGRILGPTTG